mgnify:CR=1 FL=1
MFIQTEDTPNPNALKFLPGSLVSQRPVFITIREDSSSPLAKKLFDLGAIEAVFLGADFITITKTDDADWSVMKPQVIMVIMDHFVAGLPVFENSFAAEVIEAVSDLTEIEKQIIEIIETKVRPSVAMDGGDIVYQGFKDGVVMLELRGACSGCPSSTITLKQGIESMLKYYIPEVLSVEAANS